MTQYVDPTKETFAAFRQNDREGPIHMLNLVRFREKAAYPDGRDVTGVASLRRLRQWELSGLFKTGRPNRMARGLRTHADRSGGGSVG